MTDLRLFVPFLLRGLGVTVEVFALSALVGAVSALIAGFALLSRRRWLRFIARGYVEVFRGTSAIVQLFWFYFALPLLGITLPAVLASVLALGLNGGSYGAEVVRQAVRAVPVEQYDAAAALNLSHAQQMRRVIFPQAVVAMLPSAGNLLIQMLKSTSLISLVTLQDLTFRGQLLIEDTLKTTQVYTYLLIIYFMLAFVLAQLVRLVERLMSRGLDYGVLAASPYARAR